MAKIVRDDGRINSRSASLSAPQDFTDYRRDIEVVKVGLHDSNGPQIRRFSVINVAQIAPNKTFRPTSTSPNWLRSREMRSDPTTKHIETVRGTEAKRNWAASLQ